MPEKTKHYTHKRIWISMVAVLLLVSASFTSGWYLSRIIDPGNDSYPLLAKRVQIDNPNEPFVNFSELRRELETMINESAKNNQKVSLYFEYLPTGTTVQINDQEEIIGASLMKVPIVMDLYKASELGMINIDEKVALKAEWLNDQYGTLYKKGAGYELTLREAAKYALTESDNTAIKMIFDSVDGILKGFENSLSYLDVDVEQTEDMRVKIGARAYSSIIKCLYFSCYISKDSSSELLEFLSQSQFRDRLTRYLPEELVVAHKIGTFSTRYQSDCGIVYLANRNYAICIFVEGDDPRASEEIGSLSQKVYLYLKEK